MPNPLHILGKRFIALPFELTCVKLIIIGGVALDITGTIGKTRSSTLYTSSPGKVTQTLGGVGRNVCEAAMRTGANALMVSAVGDDFAGKTIRQGMKDINMVYNALHSNDGQLIAAVADMDIFQQLDSSQITTILENEQPDLVCFDGNISSELMCDIAKKCKMLNVPAFFEPTSVPKSLKLFDHPATVSSGAVRYISPNQFELEVMSETAKMKLSKASEDIVFLEQSNSSAMQNQPEKSYSFIEIPPLAERVLPQALYLSNYIPNIVTKLGEYGCLLVARSDMTPVVRYFPPEPIEPKEIRSVTGAGDW
ncbi:hypothetical protein EC973_006659 [Apophysomyces ossiformis]|uniref:Carbohydrate kinase PfkB domain-containing protein n=1 Tax=Apophysomyces ossiformis TaxID=679940 RepID=A0A8H7BW44_9FUNG|nr:hypothetical protein EC973_006659 [Apophysomyces ossiformis]